MKTIENENFVFFSNERFVFYINKAKCQINLFKIFSSPVYDFQIRNETMYILTKKFFWKMNV